MIEVLNISVLALRKSTKSLFQAFLLILFFASVFILFGKQLYKGVLTQKCVLTNSPNISDADYAIYVANSTNWLESKGGYYLCGNGTGARKCPSGYVCLKGAEIDSFYSSNFNFYGSSVVTISQLMTLHFWQELFQRMLLTVGSLHVTYFILAFYTFFYLNGLILAIITRSYKIVIMELTASDKTATLVIQDNVNRCTRSKSIVKSPSCKSYELFVSQVKTVDRSGCSIMEDIEPIQPEPLQGHVQKSLESPVAKGLVPGGTAGIKERLQRCFSAVQSKLKGLLLSPFSESLFLACIAINSAIMSSRHYGMSSDEAVVMKLIYYSFVAIGVAEVSLKILAFGPRKYLSHTRNKIDFLCVIAAGIEVVFNGNNSVLLIFRLFKLIYPLQRICCKTCNYLMGVTDKVLSIFSHAGVVLIVFITVCIVSGMQLYGTEYFQSTDRFPDQESPRWFFRDCYSSFLLVFCMLCGDWKQPMVNAIFFTSYASNFLMLLYVIIGNLVVMNLFPGLLFYAFYYKMFSVSETEDVRSRCLVSRIFQKLLGKETTPTEVSADLESSIEEKSRPERRIALSVSQEIINQNMGKTVCSRGSRKSYSSRRMSREFEIIEDSSQEYMDDCCPMLCYQCCSFCNPDQNPVLWQTWTDLRCRLYCLVETRLFRLAIGSIIILSVVILILERTYGGHDYPIVVKVVRILEPTVIVIFILEMFLKWMAYGLQKYFKSPLGRLEFVIVLIYLADLLTIQFFDGQKEVFKALRAFRLLSVIQLLSSYQEAPPLPLKRSSCVLGSENASRESLLHLKKLECEHFLVRHCRQRHVQHIYAQDPALTDWKRSTVYTPEVCRKTAKVRSKKKKKKIPDEKEAPVVEADDCLPSFCYAMCCSCCCKENSLILNKWKRIREATLFLIRSKYFFAFLVFLSIASSVFLITEMMGVVKQESLSAVAFYADKAFAALFIAVVLVKWLGFGLKSYFTDPWCWLEFIVSVTTLLYVILESAGVAYLPSLKIVRIAYIMYASRGLKFNKQSEFLLKSIGKSVPSYVVALLLCLFLWMVHAVLGIYLFEGMSHYCALTTTEEVPVYMKRHPNDSKADCILSNGTFVVSSVNFDNIGNAYIALLQVASLQNWLNLVTEIMDNCLPSENLKYQIYTSLYFPSFILLSTYITLNFFAGVTLRTYSKFKKESKRDFVDESQKLYQSAVRKMKKVSLRKTVPAPRWHVLRFVYRMVESDNFEIAGFVLIGLHMLLIALDMYDPYPSEMFALAMLELNVFFLVIFSIESFLKLIAMRQYFFINLWNLFDVFVLTLCILGALFESHIFISPMLPAMLRLVRFVKARRYLRRHARGVLPLIVTLQSSIPAIISICLLQFLIMCVYAVFGVYLFRDSKQDWDLTGELSFNTFTQSMLLLFQMSTLAGWTDILELLTKESNCCSDTGSINWMLSIVYIVSYLLVMYYIVVKSHLIVVMENYENSMEEYENIPQFEDYRMFAEIWEKFDTSATGIIKFGMLPDLLDAMEEPFHFYRPNRFFIVSLNVPIYEGELVFYGDVMDALTRDFMAQNGHVMEMQTKLPKLIDKRGQTLTKVSSSLWRQRQNFCAQVIQNAWKRYTGRLTLHKQSPIFYSEVRLASGSDKVDTYLASNCRFSGHASV